MVIQMQTWDERKLLLQEVALVWCVRNVSAQELLLTADEVQ